MVVHSWENHLFLWAIMASMATFLVTFPGVVRPPELADPHVRGALWDGFVGIRNNYLDFLMSIIATHTHMIYIYMYTHT